MNFPRLVAFDVDGTLLTSRHELHPRTESAIVALRTEGAKVAIVTGRPAAAVGTIARLADFVVSGNGTTVTEVENEQQGAVIYDRLIPRLSVGPLLAKLRAVAPLIGFSAATALELVHEVGFEKLVPAGVEIGRRVADVLDGRGGDLRSLVAFHPHLEVDDLITLVAAHTPDELTARHSGLAAAEIVVGDVHKGSSLAWLASFLDVDRADVWAFGDGWNDHEMLAWAGRGHAMGNASAALRELADVVVPTNDEHGVAVALEAALAGRP